MTRIEPNIEIIRDWLSVAKQITIISHRNPDGDAIGSSLAMQHYLERMGHQVHCIVPSEFPTNFSWMPKSNDILVYDLDQKDCIERIKNAELLIALDFNTLDRIDPLDRVWNDQKDIPSLLIDHHIDPEPFVDEMLSDTTASSTCELVYDFIAAVSPDQKLTLTIAECLFTGLITDTGRFRHATNSHIYHIAGRLKDLGVRDFMINDYIFNNYTERTLRLLGYCLYERLEVLDDYKVAIISLSKDDYKKFKIQRGDTEGIVNYMLRMPHIQVAAFITEQPTIVKYSFRSKGDVSVQKIASKYFNGGGHKNAAGGSTKSSLQKAIDAFKKIIPELIPATHLTNKNFI